MHCIVAPLIDERQPSRPATNAVLPAESSKLGPGHSSDDRRFHDRTSLRAAERYDTKSEVHIRLRLLAGTASGSRRRDGHSATSTSIIGALSSCCNLHHYHSDLALTTTGMWLWHNVHPPSRQSLHPPPTPDHDVPPSCHINATLAAYEFASVTEGGTFDHPRVIDERICIHLDWTRETAPIRCALTLALSGSAMPHRGSCRHWQTALLLLVRRCNCTVNMLSLIHI